VSAFEFPVLIGCIVFFCWIRRGIPVREYLAIRMISAKHLVICIGAAFGVQLFGDLLSILLNQPVPEFMISVYQSSSFMPALWGTVCILAPILEELFFRGFFFEGIARSRLGAGGAVILTSLIWAVIHTQYDAFVIANLFLYGLVIGTARAVTRSVIPAIAMHMAINAVSTVQISLLLNGWPF
jgi:membrane protease YdiL (CAAX protease family)